MFIRLPRLTILALTLVGLAFAAVPGSARAADTTDVQRAAIETIVKQYILEHPEVIEEAMALAEKKHADEAQLQQQQAITSKAALIFNSPNQVVLGNPKGDVTLVEFFDYNCGYCKQALPDMISLLDSDKNLRIVLKEFPILSPGSEEAARVAVAVHLMAPDKYVEFHKRLLGGRGQANKARALDVAVEVGLDRAKVEAEAAKSDQITPALRESHAIADSLGLNGTPSYIIGNSVIPGAIGIDRLKDKIAQVRGTCVAAGGVKPC